MQALFGEQRKRFISADPAYHFMPSASRGRPKDFGRVPDRKKINVTYRRIPSRSLHFSRPADAGKRRLCMVPERKQRNTDGTGQKTKTTLHIRGSRTKVCAFRTPRALESADFGMVPDRKQRTLYISADPVYEFAFSVFPRMPESAVFGRVPDRKQRQRFISDGPAQKSAFSSSHGRPKAQTLVLSGQKTKKT